MAEESTTLLQHMLLSSFSEPILQHSVDALLKNPLQKPAPYDAGEHNQGQEDLPELHDDLIGEILAKLDGSNRQAIAGCCKRLHTLASTTFKQLALSIQPSLASLPAGQAGSDVAAEYAAAAGACMANMARIILLLPQLGNTAGNKGSVTAQPSADPTAPLNNFLMTCLAACPGGELQAKELCIKMLELQQTATGPVPCQLSYTALSRLAAAMPKLCQLSLPVLSCTAAAALPRFTSTLTTLRITVSDSPTLDHVLQLSNLRHLSVSTRKGLLYLVLSQRQISDLSRMSSLETLSLQNVLLNDCRASWEPLADLKALRELCVSSPLSAERLAHLPQSLRVLQLPFFSSSLEAIAHPEPDWGAEDPALPSGGKCCIQLAELRCKQAFTEVDLRALSKLPALETLLCDNLVVMEAATAAAQAAVVRAVAMGVPPTEVAQHVADSTGLPLLRTVKSVQLTGYHTINGLLGVLFPNLETLQIASVTVPRPAPAQMAPMPHLRSLTWPSCGVLPAMLAVSPQLVELSVTGINCQQRLDELVHMAPPPPPRQLQQPDVSKEPPVAQPLVVSLAAPTCGGFWWPSSLAKLSLAFSSTQRFRPKQVAATLMTVPKVMQRTVRTLHLRDQAQTQGPGRVVDDSVLSAAVHSLPGMQILSLADCGAVSEAGLRDALAEASPSLADVVVGGCPKVSRAQAERMPCELGRPWLKVDWMQVTRE